MKLRRPQRLQRFRGYTIDWRLLEFRRPILGEMPEYVPFDSDKGEQLLRQYAEEQQDKWLKRR